MEDSYRDIRCSNGRRPAPTIATSIADLEGYLDNVYNYLLGNNNPINIGTIGDRFGSIREFLPQGGKLKAALEQDSRNRFVVETIGEGDRTECIVRKRHQTPTAIAASSEISGLEVFLDKLYNHLCQDSKGRMKLGIIGDQFGSIRKILPRGAKLKSVLEQDSKSRFVLEAEGEGHETECFVRAREGHLNDHLGREDRGERVPSAKHPPTPVSLNYVYDESSRPAATVDDELPIPIIPGKTVRKADPRCVFVDTVEGMEAVADRLADISSVSLGCFLGTGTGGDLEVLAMAITSAEVYLVDCGSIDRAKTRAVLGSVLFPRGGEDGSRVSPNKLLHGLYDRHKDLLAIQNFFFGSASPDATATLWKDRHLLDTQLLGELVWKTPSMQINDLLVKLKLPEHPRREGFADISEWKEYAALQVACLQRVAEDNRLDALLQKQVEQKQGLTVDILLGKLLEATVSRAVIAIRYAGARSLCFNKGRKFAPSSTELMRALFPEDGFYGEPLVVESDVDEVLDVLPEVYSTKFGKSTNSEVLLSTERVTDFYLNYGYRACCWHGNSRKFLCDNEHKLVTLEEIENILSHLGTVGSDNRAGLDGSNRTHGSLHRFSVMRNKSGDIYGMTIRVGRNVKGNASMLMDLLRGDEHHHKSILILGKPGSGKTTIVREAARMLAEEEIAIVVDTSNEIAGDGMRPHSCIGYALRMMVPSLDEQDVTMVECIQNHKPHVMIIDEIGRPREVKAASTSKQRGVRMLASAHGDLRSLLKNGELNGVIGGIEKVTIGDEMARDEAKKKKLRSSSNHEGRGEGGSEKFSKTLVTRRSAPTFEIVVEVFHDQRDEWRIVTDSAVAVDRILEGESYSAQRRTRDPDTGAMRMKWVEA